MLTSIQAIALGLLQGLTELFPVSSLGHGVLIPQLLHWGIDEGSSPFVAFLVAVHLATALVLLGFFWRDWVRIVAGIFRSLIRRKIAGDTYARIGWLLVVGTVPAGILGLLFQNELQTLFGAGALVAFVLVLNGLLLWGAEILRRRASAAAADDSALAALSYKQAFGIGILQSIALMPGFSRTGAAMTGGLLSGLSHESAARFSFLLSTPIILAAAVLKVPDLFRFGGNFLGAAILGFLAAALAAYVSVRFLLKYFKTNTLKPFAIYCIVAGLLALAAIVLG